ncbi:MAG: amidohydrolase family protein [Myxococcales bacterium]|nr:amidohydrolase family protein [Myxococcales bacterium]
MMWVCAVLSAAWAAEDGGTLAERQARGRAAIEVPEAAAAGPVILTGATVWSGVSEPVLDAYVVMQDGTISAVGQGQPPSVPDAVQVDVAGAHVTPGLIDTHSHLGVYPSPWGRAHSDGNEATAPVTAGVWAEHSVWPQDPGFLRAIAGGITTMQILPGSANLIGGRGVVVRSIPARGSRAMRFPDAPETVKMACGENPKRVYGHHRNSAPSTRMGNLRGQRAAFLAAKAYAKKWERHDGPSDADGGKKRKKKKKSGSSRGGDAPDRDLGKETLAGVLDGSILPQIHCYRADDMLSMLQLADEFGFSIRSFHHATEAYKIRDILAEREVAASVWADWWGFKLEAYDAVPAGAAMLHDAGAKAVIHSDSAIGIQRLNQEAAKAMRAGQELGLSTTETDAMSWITINPAWALGIDDQTGSLEVGKRADVVVWDGHPLSVYSSAQQVFVDGALRYDAERPATWSDFEIGQEVAP